MDPRARAEIVPFLLRCGEGFTDWLYLDDVGVPTIGVGNALFSLADALALDWGSSGQAAITAAWNAVHARRDLVGRGAGAFRAVTSVRATRASIDSLIARDLAAFEAALSLDWPGWEDAPWQAQVALMRLAWACGARLAPKWPRLHAAWVAKDWPACSRECRIPALDETEPLANAAEAAFFVAAAGEAA